MTVAELIEKLKTMPQDAKILIPKLEVLHQTVSGARVITNTADLFNPPGYVVIEGSMEA